MHLDFVQLAVPSVEIWKTILSLYIFCNSYFLPFKYNKMNRLLNILYIYISFLYNIIVYYKILDGPRFFDFEENFQWANGVCLYYTVCHLLGCSFKFKLKYVKQLFNLLSRILPFIAEFSKLCILTLIMGSTSEGKYTNLPLTPNGHCRI